MEEQVQQPTSPLPLTARRMDDLRPGDPAAIDGYTVVGRVPGNHLSDVYLVQHERFGRCVL